MKTPRRYVRRDKTVTWQIRFRHLGKETSETFLKKAEAERFAKLLDALGPQGALDQLYAGDQVPEVPTLDQVAADYIRLRTGIEDGTRLTYERLWARTWSKQVGHLPANMLSADIVREAINELAGEYKKKSLENQRGLLAGVVGRCIEKGYLTQNPTKGIRLPEGRRVELAAHIDPDGDEDDGEMVCLTHEEWEILERSLDPHYRSFVRFLVGTGCRYGETVMLRPADFDLTARTVRVRRALKWSPDGKRVVGPPKTKKGRRTVKIPTELVDELRELVDVRGRGGLVFTAPRGGPIAHRTFWSKNWRPATWRAQFCEQHRPRCQCGTGEPQRCRQHEDLPSGCGCPGTLFQAPRIHDMRHTHASWLLAAGVPIHVVQARLGHESIQTTVNTYGHLLPDAQLAAAAAADLAFAARLPAEQLRLRAARAALGELTASELTAVLEEYGGQLRELAAGQVVAGELVRD